MIEVVPNLRMPMNKGVAIAGGVVTGIFLLLTILGSVIAGSTVEDLENFEDDPSPYYTQSVDGEVTFTFIDDDRQGSIAFEVLLDLDYVDEDKDGMIDNCDGFQVTVTDENGIDVTENVSKMDCWYDEFYAEDPMHKGKVIHTYVCDTYFSTDDCRINSNYTVTVTLRDTNETKNFVLFDNDAYSLAMLTAIGDDIGAALGGGALATLGCCGIPIGLIILIIGLALQGPQQPFQGYHVGSQMPMAGTMPANQMPMGGAVPMQAPVQSMQPPLSSDATGTDVPDMAGAYANQFSQPPSE